MTKRGNLVSDSIHIGIIWIRRGIPAKPEKCIGKNVIFTQ
jgi:hypothetical protein